FAHFGRSAHELILGMGPGPGPAAPEAVFAPRRSRLDPKRRWVDGTPENSFYVYGLSLLFPGARVIHLLRDVLPVVRSLRTFSRAGGPDFTEQAAYEKWLRCVRACVAAERALGSGTVLRVTYDDLTGRPEQAVRRCLAFAGEEYSPDCLRP